jgi:hypothetical protein
MTGPTAADAPLDAAWLDRAVAAQPNFARAFDLLARDAGLQASEPERLARLRRLSGIE